MLKLQCIKKDYPLASETVHALKGIDIAFRKNEFVSILGPSGCGKTTLLNIIGGLDHYTSGDLVIGGRSTKSFTDRDWDVYRNHRIGFVFQSYNLIPHQTILGNVELALTIGGVSREERTARAKTALDRVGLLGMYHKRPNQLSGGQCQRVAIARALVNDPEILLADEPTGALDTVTSVQIMDLIKEISAERLVIMVTHNPELAERYSTRIVRLLDGEVVEDSHPFSFEEEAAECEKTNAEEEARIAAVAAKAKDPRKAEKAERKKKERAKMSFFTAFLLSAHNLISKRGRTAMVGFAGSIGIIGIAIVLAFSAGIKGYVVSMQDDMLSGNPITISESAYDLDALTGMMSTQDKTEILREPNRAYINSVVAYLAEMSKNVDSLLIKNDLTENYINYVLSMPSEYFAAMTVGYGLDMTNNIYTAFRTSADAEAKTVAISHLLNIYTSILGETDFSKYASYVTSLVPSFAQAPDSSDYIASQYDVYGKIAEGADEVMLVLNSKSELSDVLLASLGYYTQEEFLDIVYKATGSDSYNEARYREYFTFDELLGRGFTWYPNDTIFKKSESPLSPFTYAASTDGISDKESGLSLRVVGILSPKENVSYGCLKSGIYYTKALTDRVLDTSADSEIVRYMNEKEMEGITSMPISGMPTGIFYTYEYTYEGVTKTATGYVGETLDMSSLMNMGAGGAGSGGSAGGGAGSGGFTNLDLSSYHILSLRNVGGNRLANKISIYPVSFDDKSLVTNYLDAWNGDGTVTVGQSEIKAEDRKNVTYTDTLSLIISIINTMIDVISYALIAFTSVSLLVSTVMIGIITYVSVVERIKEIGVIRALGGRKRDVSHLFNAETFIIGLLAGLFGVIFTYLACAVISAVLYPLIGIRNIALLPVKDALLMILLSVLLTLISGLIPARSAAKKDPVVALRTE